MEFLNNCWYVAASTGELVDNKPLARRICGEDLVLFRTGAGTVAVMEDRCPHRMAPLSLGMVVGDTIECGYHGARFDGGGRCVGIPCHPDAKPAVLQMYRARSFRAVERFGFVFVWFGDQPADEGQLPNWDAYACDGWVGVQGYHDVAGDYQLLLDNLNDLSHLSYVHRNTIGKADGHAWTEVPVTVETVDGKVFISRVMRNVLPTAFAKVMLNLGDDVKVDRFQTSEFQLPSMTAVVLGTEPTEHALERMAEPTHVVLNAVTPSDANSSHYFWSVNLKSSSPDDVLPQTLYKMTRAAFDEDEVMIEAQQRRILSAPKEQRLLSFRTDRAVGAARHLIEQALRSQRG